MELDRYVSVIRRRLGLIGAIVLLTAIVSASYAVLAPTDYQATTQLLLNPVSPPNAATTYYYPPYYEELAAQFILDDFIGVIEGTTFSEQVIALLKQSPQTDVRVAAAKLRTVDDAQKLSKQFTINRINRLLQVQVRAKTQDEALAIEQAVDQLVIKDGPTIFAQLAQDRTGAPAGSAATAAQQFSTVSVTVSDEPHIIQKPSRLHAGLFWLLRTAVGLVAALAIVLVLHYFDDRLYDAYDVQEMLGLPVLGTVDASAVAARRPAVQERVATG